MLFVVCIDDVVAYDWYCGNYCYYCGVDVMVLMILLLYYVVVFCDGVVVD